jgi:beta-glucosidase
MCALSTIALPSSAVAIEFPDGFLWGVATAAHQIEGANWNCDWWEFEHVPGTPVVEPSGDACDSFHRYPDDVRLVRELGFGAYRYSIEWARIEPEEGFFSRSALDHYRRMLATCREHGVLPVVTFHHFTTPRWLAAQGGWENAATADRFARFCERAVAHLGDLIGMGCTINEPNVASTLGYLVGIFAPGKKDFDAWGRANATYIEGHRKGYEAIKAGPGHFPLGVTVAMDDWWAPEGCEEKLAAVRHTYEDVFCEAARGDDYLGVQAYSRLRLDEQGLPTGPEEGVEVLDMGYEYWPQAVEVAIRRAAEVAQVPIFVTESGIGTTDDAQRIRYLTAVLEGVGRTLDDEIDVRGYFCWSLLDNFEWNHGYGPRFGIVAVDRETQSRTLKPSASWLGRIARTNRLSA